MTLITAFYRRIADGHQVADISTDRGLAQTSERDAPPSIVTAFGLGVAGEWQ